MAFRINPPSTAMSSMAARLPGRDAAGRPAGTAALALGDFPAEAPARSAGVCPGRGAGGVTASVAPGAPAAAAAAVRPPGLGAAAFFARTTVRVICDWVVTGGRHCEWSQAW